MDLSYILIHKGINPESPQSTGLKIILRSWRGLNQRIKVLPACQRLRPERESNPRVTVLQTVALPLGYQAIN